MVVNYFCTKKSEDPQSTLDHSSTTRSEPTKKSTVHKKSERRKAEDEKSRSRIIWVSATRSPEGEKWKAECRMWKMRNQSLI